MEGEYCNPHAHCPQTIWSVREFNSPKIIEFVEIGNARNSIPRQLLFRGIFVDMMTPRPKGENMSLGYGLGVDGMDFWGRTKRQCEAQ